MSLWFVSAAILPEIVAEAALGPGRAAALSSAVQLGFVAGALALAAHGTADRFDPRRVFAACGAPRRGAPTSRCSRRPSAARRRSRCARSPARRWPGVYPVGMKIAVGWGARDRGLLVGLIVGAVTLGSASPHLIALLGGADWRATVLATSALAALGGAAALAPGSGRRTPAPRASIRARCGSPGPTAGSASPILGYFGHMWELYAFWAWIGAAATVALAAAGRRRARRRAAADLRGDRARRPRLRAGGRARRPDRQGARRARRDGAERRPRRSATALAFHGPVWLFAALVLVWGLAVIPDSAQFSALVADAAPPERAGSLMTLQTALGFLLTFFTVQAVPGRRGRARLAARRWR